MGGRKVFRVVHDRATVILAWVSFALAIAGGALAADMWIGRFIHNLIGMFPNWLAILALVGVFFGMALDVILDLEPNRFAIFAAIILPSLAGCTNGKLAATIDRWSADLLHFIDRDLSGWLGTSSSTALALAAILVSWLIARRVVKRGGGGGRARASVSMGV